MTRQGGDGTSLMLRASRWGIGGAFLPWLFACGVASNGSATGDEFARETQSGCPCGQWLNPATNRCQDKVPKPFCPECTIGASRQQTCTADVSNALHAQKACTCDAPGRWSCDSPCKVYNCKSGYLPNSNNTRCVPASAGSSCWQQSNGTVVCSSSSGGGSSSGGSSSSSSSGGSSSSSSSGASSGSSSGASSSSSSGGSTSSSSSSSGGSSSGGVLFPPITPGGTTAPTPTPQPVGTAIHNTYCGNATGPRCGQQCQGAPLFTTGHGFATGYKRCICKASGSWDCGVCDTSSLWISTCGGTSSSSSGGGPTSYCRNPCKVFEHPVGWVHGYERCYSSTGASFQCSCNTDQNWIYHNCGSRR